MMNNEIKTKQALIKRISTPHPNGNPASGKDLTEELAQRDRQIEVLNDRVLV